MPPDPPLDPESGRAEALLRVGRLSNAAGLARDIAARTMPGSIRRRALIVLVESSRRGHALDPDDVAQLEASAEELDCPSGERAQALAMATLARCHLCDRERAVDLGQRALVEAERGRDEVGRCLARATLGKALQRDPQRWAEGEQLLRDAVDYARISDHPLVHFADAFISYAAVLAARGQVARAFEHHGEQLHHAERLGLLPVQVTCLGLLAFNLVARGRWDKAPGAVDAWWDLAAAHDIHSETPIISVNATRLPLGRGEFDEAALWLERADQLTDTQNVHETYRASLANERALLLEATQNAPSALAHLKAVRGTLRQGSACDMRMAVTLVRLATAAGDSATARAVTASVEKEAEQFASRNGDLTLTARVCRALVGGPVDDALAAFRRLDPERVRNRIDLHLHQETLGQLLAEAGRRDEAVELLNDATDAWERIGATFFAARTLARLRALGQRRGVRGTRDRPATGWQSLTPTEREISELVADDLTYRQIGERLYISKRTVETHIGHIFCKLGVKGRREISALARSTAESRSTATQARRERWRSETAANGSRRDPDRAPANGSKSAPPATGPGEEVAGEAATTSSDPRIPAL